MACGRLTAFGSTEGTPIERFGPRREAPAVAGRGQRRPHHRGQRGEHVHRAHRRPGVVLTYTGVVLQVPVAALPGELAVTVLVPTFLGVAIRTRWPARIHSIEPVLAANGSRSHRSCCG
jgi:hypothetical protein